MTARSRRSTGRTRSTRRTVAAPTVCPHRLRTLAALFIIVMGGFVYRLADLQLTPDEALAQPLSNTLRTTELEARRGSLIDRQGRPLAMSLPSATVVADPRLVDAADVPRVVGELSRFIDTDPEILATRLSGDRHFVYLDRQVDAEIGEAIMALDLPGVYLLEEPRRQHPNGDCTGMALLGRVDTDHQGISGLEKLYDDRLTGTPGTRAVEVSGFDGRATIVGGEQVIEPAIPGEELQLALHRDVQFKAQEVIEAAVVEHDAALGVALVMVPSTGEIIAAVGASRDEETGAVECTTNNLPFTHIYEPGSTMKTISLGAVLDAGLTTPHEQVALEEVRTYALDDGQVFTAVDWFPHDQLTYSPTEILTLSSNIGTATLAERLDPVAMNETLAAFGFGQTTGVDFPGESAGIVKDLRRSTVALPTTSYGQGVAVTPIQMLQAYNTIANGGVAVDPVLVVDEIGAGEPQRVVSDETAGQLMTMMRSVVEDEDGTGRAAAIAGFDVVGKTGTAWQPCGENGVGYECENGRYFRHYTPSFAGIVSNDGGPQFSVLVIIDDPQGEHYGGGSVAAPVFAELAAFTARQLRIPATSSGVTTTAVRAETATVPVPVVDAADADESSLDEPKTDEPTPDEDE